ncbi:hypothetical protein EPA93_34920 [Ktedonosporobacter rubrisoli]|uniref:Uncharacterized protein n=1 Tax=Ktedonosporobacter rubrisoli TaxID=2509675 RepID=A0A4P6JZ65_KTERU|nr:hypothetical protein [Ktedonosporobacter rubrisoli]QBD80885.1 hypothetical protein EPA93_34920 [Ktedonosporobacter rubrisoli]
MVSPESPIFREQAVQQYTQRQKQEVRLRVISPSAFVFFWLALLLTLSVGILGWFIQVPVNISGRGVIVEATGPGQGQKTPAAALFFAPERWKDLRSGQAASISIGSTQLTGKVERVDSNLINPAQVGKYFKSPGELAQAISGPSAMALISLSNAPGASAYVGSICSAQIRLGTQNVLSLLPDAKQILQIH